MANPGKEQSGPRSHRACGAGSRWRRAEPTPQSAARGAGRPQPGLPTPPTRAPAAAAAGGYWHQERRSACAAGPESRPTVAPPAPGGAGAELGLTRGLRRRTDGQQRPPDVGGGETFCSKGRGTCSFGGLRARPRHIQHRNLSPRPLLLTQVTKTCARTRLGGRGPGADRDLGAPCRSLLARQAGLPTLQKDGAGERSWPQEATRPSAQVGGPSADTGRSGGPGGPPP